MSPSAHVAQVKCKRFHKYVNHLVRPQGGQHRRPSSCLTSHPIPFTNALRGSETGFLMKLDLDKEHHPPGVEGRPASSSAFLVLHWWRGSSGSPGDGMHFSSASLARLGRVPEGLEGIGPAFRVGR